MEPDIKKAIAVKSQVIEFMREYVFAGDDNPQRPPDAEGAYHYTDRKIIISCLPSHREGWFGCAVEVHLIRRTWMSRQLDLVLSAGHGTDVWSFRPGQWIDYVNNLAAAARREREATEAANKSRSAELQDTRFAPIDDSALFKDE